MTEGRILRIEGHVDSPREFTVEALRQMDEAWQVRDLTRFGFKRGGDGVRLAGLLQFVGPRQGVTHLGLHGTRDDFHASIPLAEVRDAAVVVYQHNGQALAVSAGGPFRFFVPDHAVCHTDEIDECANVKFLDRIELTIGKGYDNRPQDDEAHAKLHEHDE